MPMNKGETAQMAIERLDREVLRLEADLKAQTSMTVARLGGTVEGRPTEKQNYLQRIDELMETERLISEINKILLGAISDTAKVIRIEGVLEKFLKRVDPTQNCAHDWQELGLSAKAMTHKCRRCDLLK